MSSSTVSPKQGQELAAAVGAYSYVEVSSLSNDGVEDLITEVVDAAKTYWELRCAKKKKKCPACVIIWGRLLTFDLPGAILCDANWPSYIELRR